MHPDIYQLIESAVGLIALFGLGMGLKVLVWDRLAPRSFRDATERRLAELEGHYRTLVDLHERQWRRLEEQDERLDFNDRVMARGRNGFPPSRDTPEVSTPV